MLERLIENWLDNASERSYQPCFCQMLVAQGHRVLHSTRHAPIEFGKDVISIAADGVPCAFQLKGNPGGRLTHAQFREIQPQLWELAIQQIVFPGVPQVQHRTYLVTNGNVEEEVQRAIDDMNRNFAAGGSAARIEIISRGVLLNWGIELGASLWPQELDEVTTLLELLTYEGKATFPIEKLDRLLVATLRVRPQDDARLTGDEFRRRASSAALLVGIGLSRFAARQNHYATVVAWTVLAVYVIGCAEKNEHPLNAAPEMVVNLAEEEAFNGVLRLLDEVVEQKSFAEGGALEDWVVFRWRYVLLVGLFSVLWFRLREREQEQFAKRDESLRGLLSRRHEFLELWGEGAIPRTGLDFVTK